MPSYTSSAPTERPDHVEPGDHRVEVIDAVESVSKGGHDMIELKLRTGAGSHLYDFLVFVPNAFWKIDSFRAATGETVVPGEDVEITPDDLVGRTATARLAVEEFNGRKRNKVAAWLRPRAGKQATAAKPASQTPAPRAEDDDIPF